MERNLENVEDKIFRQIKAKINRDIRKIIDS